MANGEQTTALNGNGTIDAAAHVVPPDVTPAKPKRPRPGALVYDQAELAYVLKQSVRQIRRLKHRLPAPLPYSRQPRWARSAIDEWLANGGKVRR